MGSIQRKRLKERKMHMALDMALYRQHYKEHKRKMDAFLYKQINYTYYMFDCEQKHRELEERRVDLQLRCAPM